MSDLSDLSRMSDLSQPSTGRVAGSDGRKKKKMLLSKGVSVYKKILEKPTSLTPSLSPRICRSRLLGF